MYICRWVQREKWVSETLPIFLYGAWTAAMQICSHSPFLLMSTQSPAMLNAFLTRSHFAIWNQFAEVAVGFQWLKKAHAGRTLKFCFQYTQLEFPTGRGNCERESKLLLSSGMTKVVLYDNNLKIIHNRYAALLALLSTHRDNANMKHQYYRDFLYSTEGVLDNLR